MSVEMVERIGFDGALSELKAVMDARPEAGSDASDWVERLHEANGRLDRYTRRPEPELRLRTPLRPFDHRTDTRYFNLMMLGTHELRSIAKPGWAARVGPELMHADLQELNDSLIWTDLLMCGNGQTRYATISRDPLIRMAQLRQWRDWETLVADYARVLSIGTASAGGNWAPTLMSARLQQYIAPELRVAQLFRQVDMTSRITDNPVLGLDIQGYYVPESTQIPAADPTTNKATMTAAKMAARCVVSGEVDEDTAISLAPTLTADLGKAIGRAIEDCIINGDTAGSHQDSDVSSATDRRKAWDGLRKKALISSMPNQDLATMNDTNMQAIPKAMGRFGSVPSQGVWIVGHKFIAVAIATPLVTFYTLDRIGPAVSPMPGQVAYYAGRPVILSEFVREDTNATAVYDGTTTTKTTVLYVNREAFAMGRRRDILVQRAAQTALDVDQVNYTGTWRGSFVELLATAAAANKIVGIGRNFS